MLRELARLVRDCDSSFVTYRFHDAMDRLYETAWHSYCDWYVEMAKLRMRDGVDEGSRGAAAWTAVTALDVILRLLHPFMPYVTEECAQHLPDAAPTLQRRPWPEAELWWTGAETERAHEEVTWLIDLVQRIRSLRQERGVATSERDRLHVHVGGDTDAMALDNATRLIAELVPATIVDVHGNGARPEIVVAGALRAEVVVKSATDVDPSRATRRLKELDALISRFTAQLGNPGFQQRAPAGVVTDARRKLAQAETEREALRRSLESG